MKLISANVPGSENLGALTLKRSKFEEKHFTLIF